MIRDRLLKRSVSRAARTGVKYDRAVGRGRRDHADIEGAFTRVRHARCRLDRSVDDLSGAADVGGATVVVGQGLDRSVTDVAADAGLDQADRGSRGRLAVERKMVETGQLVRE